MYSSDDDSSGDSFVDPFATGTCLKL
jgi:hypothetical protein